MKSPSSHVKNNQDLALDDLDSQNENGTSFVSKRRIGSSAMHYFALTVLVLNLMLFLFYLISLDSAVIFCASAPCNQPFKPLGGYLNGYNTGIITPIIYLTYFLLSFFIGKKIFYKKNNRALSLESNNPSLTINESDLLFEKKEQLVEEKHYRRINPKPLHYFLIILYAAFILLFLLLNVVMDGVVTCTSRFACADVYRPLGGHLSGENADIFTSLIYIAYFVLTYYLGKFIFYKNLFLSKLD